MTSSIQIRSNKSHNSEKTFSKGGENNQKDKEVVVLLLHQLTNSEQKQKEHFKERPRPDVKQKSQEQSGRIPTVLIPNLF